MRNGWRGEKPKCETQESSCRGRKEGRKMKREVRKKTGAGLHLEPTLGSSVFRLHRTLWGVAVCGRGGGGVARGKDELRLHGGRAARFRRRLSNTGPCKRSSRRAGEGFRGPMSAGAKHNTHKKEKNYTHANVVHFCPGLSCSCAALHLLRRHPNETKWIWIVLS